MHFPNHLRKPLFYFALGCMLFMSLWPRAYVDKNVPKAIQALDFDIHTAAYLMFAAAALFAYGNRGRPWRSRVVVWGACTAFGALMEILQEVFPGINRSYQLSDMLSNTLGACAGVLLFLPRFWPRKP